MLKEIHEQPTTIFDCLRGRLDMVNGEIIMAGVQEHIEALKNAKRIIVVACGTSWHAGLVAEYIIEELCRIPVEVEYASEFRYRNPIIEKGDVLFAISQSGETADTLVAIEKAKNLAAAHHVNVNFQCSDWQSFDWKANHYDTIAGIFFQFADPTSRLQIFEKLNAALKPGGTLIIQGYGLEQMQFKTGGPGILENLYDEALLLASFKDYKILRI
jgi:SAM-dependent methyltransferase